MLVSNGRIVMVLCTSVAIKFRAGDIIAPIMFIILNI